MFTLLIVWASLGSVIAILVKPKKIPAAMEEKDDEADKLTLPKSGKEADNQVSSVTSPFGDDA